MHRFLEWHASQYMTKAVNTVTADMTLRELSSSFDRYDFNSFPVMDGETAIGLVTKFDFLKAFVFTTQAVLPHYEEVMKRPVSSIMTEDIISVTPETPLTRVLELMIAKRARSFPVLEAGRKLAGMISRTDLTRALSEAETRV